MRGFEEVQVRERCSKCGTFTGQDRETCEACKGTGYIYEWVTINTLKEMLEFSYED